MNRCPPFVAESQSSLWEGCQTTSRLYWNCPEQNSATPLFAQVRELLGEDCEPDAEFFVRCWTADVATAANDLRDRHRLRTERAASPFWSFRTITPSFSAEEFVRSRQACASTAPLSQPGGVHSQDPLEEENPGADGHCDFDMSGLSTVERARRILGVAADSTPAQIKIAYRHLVRRYHPDQLERKGSQARQTATERMMAINKAYDLLNSCRAGQPLSS